MSKVQTKLVPGTYRLAYGIDPLRADKRKTADWRYLPQPAGTLFFYKEWTYDPMDNGAMVTVQRIYLYNGYEHQSVAPNDSYEARLLEEALVLLEEKPSFWILREHSKTYALDVLDVLVATNRLTFEEVQNALKLANASPALLDNKDALIPNGGPIDR